MRLIYIAHPVSGDVAANLANAKQWLRWAHIEHPCCAPIAPWIPACEVFDDSDAQAREHGLLCDMAIIERCDELWLCGGIVSAGMRIEQEHAMRHRVIVRNLTGLGVKPPANHHGIAKH